MNEFFSGFWSWWIIIPTVGGMIGLVFLATWLSGGKQKSPDQVKSMGHIWDENLEELNNPLPRWWLNMYYGGLIFSAVYLILYPGLGSFAGVLDWTSIRQYHQELQRAEDKYGPIFAHYGVMPLDEIAANPEGNAIGRRIYLNYCAVCHGSDARGSRGFPNLADGVWLYGGTPEKIKESILVGRNGNMPPMGAAVGGDEGVRQVAAYVMSLSGRTVDPDLAAAGKAKFVVCAGCHGMDGKGNASLGAPNLTDNVWLYGGSPGLIEQSIREGRAGRMPSHKDFLGEDKSHIVAAYVYGLSASND